MLKFTFTTLLPTIALAAYIVPLPSGPYGVSIQDVLFTDHSLPDPYLNLSYRRVPVSIISQAGSSADCEPALQQYMPNITAAFWEQTFTAMYGLPFAQTLTETQLMTCKPKSSQSSAPVLLFGPGAGISRYFYNILGTMITAQSGYTVITYDIPGQTGIVEFSDDSVEYEAAATDSPTFTNTQAIGNVTRDALIVLDGLLGSRTNNVTSSPPLTARYTRQVAIAGHSQGGAAALEALVADSRLSCGANLDGGLNDTAFGYLANPNSTQYTTKKPFAIFEHQGFNQSSVISWPIVWADVLRGSKWQFQLNGTQHDSFGDFLSLVELYGIEQRSNASSEAVYSLFGSTPGAIVLEVVRDVLSAFLAYGFGQRPATSVAQRAHQFQPWGFEIVNQTVVNNNYSS